MTKGTNIAVLISGRGSNLRSLIEQRSGYVIDFVCSNNPDALGLDYARSAGVETAAFPRADFPSVHAQKEAIFRAVYERMPDFVFLAGYMQIVPAVWVEQLSGRLVNIHPSLLPKFPGLDTHRRAIEAGEGEHGCTVHFVDIGVDTGPIIAQAKCDVLSTDTESTLAARVLEQEHRLYPWAANMLAAGEIRFQDGHVRYSTRARDDAAARRFSIPGS